MGGRPHQARRKIDGREIHLTHAEHADNARNHGLDAGHEAADGNAFSAMAPHKVFAAGEELGIAVEGPQCFQPVAEQAARPVGNLIARDGAGGGCQENRPKAKMPSAHKHSRAHQNGGRGHEQADDQQRFAKCDQEDQGDGPAGVQAEII